MAEPPPKQSFIGRLRDFFFRPSSLSLIAVVAIGMFSGLVFWGGFNTAMEATNTIEFCTGCHEMRDNVYQEYQDTIHYTNRTGVRAICSDCHVPKDWVHKVRAQDPGEPRGVRQARRRHDRHQGEIRGEADGAGARTCGRR